LIQKIKSNLTYLFAVNFRFIIFKQFQIILMRIFIFVIFLFFLKPLIAQSNLYQSILIAENLTKNVNAVVRLDDMVVHLISKNEMNVTLKRVVTVLNKYGDKDIQASIGYDNSRKINKLYAVAYDGLGNELGKFKEKDFTDVSAVDGGTLYSDYRVKYLNYTPVKYPYTMEFNYEYTTSNTGEILPSWYFLDGYLVSTEKSKITFLFDEVNLMPEVKERNLEGIDFMKSANENSIVYEAKNIAAYKREGLSPSFSRIAPKLIIRPINFTYEGYDASIHTWNDLGKWMYANLIIGRDELTESTKGIIKSLTNGVTDDLEKAKIVYKYVQDNTRYISVQVGIGGMQPISAIDVDRVKYGDCKGLSNYTKALLETVGVTSYYTHVEAGSYKVDFEDDFASLADGNHVILAIPYQDNYYWIDCTSQIHPFGFIGDFTDGRKVLIIKPDGGEIAKTTAYVDEDNHQDTTAKITLSKDGGIVADIVIITKGIQYDDRFYLEDKAADDIKKHYKSYWGSINNLSIDEFSFTNDRNKIVFTETVQAKASNYGSLSGDRILFTPNVFNKNNNVPDRARNRKFPLEIQRGYFDEDEFTISLPVGYGVEAMPNSNAVENEFGWYKTSLELSEDKKSIQYKRQLLIREGMYANEKYEVYRDFRKKVALGDSAKIVLIKKE